MSRRRGEYELLSALGVGGMGVVYRARHGDTGREVALKTVACQNGVAVEALYREVQALSRLSHPGIIRIVDHGIAEGLPWYAMELLRGMTLREHLDIWFDRDAESSLPTMPSGRTASRAPRAVAGREPSRVQRRELLRIARQLCDALTTLHGAGLVHGDLNPGNIFIQDDGQPVLFDFGLASQFRREDGRAPLEAAGQVRGTFDYMAPEQVQGAPLDARADLYGLGCTLFEGLTGQRLFADASPSNVLSRHLSTPPRRPSSLVAELDPALDELVLGLLAKSPAQRIGYAEDVADALDALDSSLASAKLARVDAAFDRSGSGALSAANSQDITATLDTALAHGTTASFDTALAHGRTASVDAALANGTTKSFDAALAYGKTSHLDAAHAYRPAPRVEAVPGHRESVELEPARLPNARLTSATPRRERTYVYRPTFHGREPELVRGERLLELLSDGVGGLCFLVGESGAGKTSLMSELATQARQRGMRTVMCECQDVGVGGATRVAAPALHPFRPLLRAIANDCRNDDLLRARVLGEREETLHQYEPSLRSYQGQPPARDGGVRDATGDRVLRDLTVTLGAYAAEQPLLLCLDDLQWADALTLRFLTATHADFYTQRGILVVGSVRSTDIPSDLERTMAADEVTRIDVGALDRTSVEAMVQDMLALASPPPHLVEFLHLHAGGNPLFIAEYLHAAVAEGLVVRNKGTWVLKAAGRERFRQLSTPESVCELVLRRFGLLNAEERAFAEAAAVLGRRCTEALLSATAELSAPRAASTLESLARAHILQVAADDSVYFTHDRVRESIYFNLSESSRRALHRRAALALEHGLSETESDRLTYPQLAYHLRESEQLASASRYFELAGVAALYGAATRDARAHLEQALLLDPGDSVVRTARLHRAVAEACLGLGDLTPMTEHLEQALVRTNVRLPENARARTRFIVASTLQQLRRRLQPRAYGLSDAHEQALAREACLALQLLSIRYIFEDDAPNVITTALAAVNMGEAAGGRLRMASPYSSLGYVARLARLRPVADHYFRMAIESAKRANDLDDHAEARSNQAAAALGAADWRAAEPAVDDALALSKLARNPQQEEVALTVRFYIDFFRGRYDEALASLPPLLESASARGNAQHMGWALVMRATVSQERGDLESAERDLDEARGQLLSVKDRVTETLCIGLLAGVKARRGCYAEGLELSREASARIADKFPVVFSVAKGLEGAALAPLLAWQEAVERGTSTGSLPAQADKACQHYLSYGRIFPVGAPGSHVMLAWARRLRGDGVRARWHGYRALALGTRLQMPHPAACAHAQLASLAPRLDLHDKRAAAGFARLGLTYPLRAAPREH